MPEHTYKAILYAVGNLPFWTGKKKLIRLLAGQEGSFWNKETPLKPVYLNQPFFGELSEQSDSEVRRAVQELLDARYLTHEKVSGDKPYRVIKFSSKGAKKYYNLLVKDRGFQDPFWWLHHVYRLREATNSPINSGGEILEYNESVYLTQTPPYRSDTERVQSEQTVALLNSSRMDSLEGHYQFRDLDPVIDGTPSLLISEDTSVERVNQSDLGRKLSHFQSEASQLNPPDPYVIEGKLIDATDPDKEGIRRVTLQNDDRELTVLVRTNQIPDDLTLQSQQRYAVGPVTETTDEDNRSPNETVLAVEQSGELRPRRP